MVRLLLLLLLQTSAAGATVAMQLVLHVIVVVVVIPFAITAVEDTMRVLTMCRSMHASRSMYVELLLECASG